MHNRNTRQSNSDGRKDAYDNDANVVTVMPIIIEVLIDTYDCQY